MNKTGELLTCVGMLGEEEASLRTISSAGVILPAPPSHWRTSTDGRGQSPAVHGADEALSSATGPNDNSKTQEAERLHGCNQEGTRTLSI